MRCIRTRSVDGIRLQVSGALDALTVEELRPILDAVVSERPRRVVVDFTELTLLDSSGVGAIVSLYKRMKAEGGTVVIAHAHDQPRLVLQSLGLDRIFSMVGAVV